MLDFRNPKERAAIMTIHKSSVKDRESMRKFNGVIRAYLATTRSADGEHFMWFAIQDTSPEKQQYNNKFIRMKFTERGTETIRGLLKTWGVEFTGNLENDVAQLSPTECPVDLMFYEVEIKCNKTGEPRIEQRIKIRYLPPKWWPCNAAK